MTRKEAQAILRALAEGLDPRTGEALSETGPWSDPRVIRALFLAVESLHETEGVAPSRSNTGRDSHATRPAWSSRTSAGVEGSESVGVRRLSACRRACRTRCVPDPASRGRSFP